MPLQGEAFLGPAPVSRFAGFLGDLTGRLPAGQVYTVIDERLRWPDHDQRMDGVQPDPAAFEALWRQLTTGSGLPSAAWESVVLPVVVAFSDDNNVKAHLELATSFWVAAKAADDFSSADSADGPEPAEVVHAERLEPPRAYGLPARAPAVVIGDGAPTIRRGRALTVVIAVILSMAALVLWSMRSTPSGHPSPSDIRAVPVNPPGAETPTATPASVPTSPLPAEAGDPPAAVALPAPSASWTGPGPATAPGAPTGLAVVRVTMTTIQVAWHAPADTGSGGIAYYRVSLDGQDGGWITQTSVTISRQAPNSSHTIAITAYSAAGLASPSSDPVTATTAATPAPSASPSPPMPAPTTGKPVKASTVARRP